MPASLRHPHALLVSALVLGICADYLFFERQLGISLPLFVLLCLLTLGWLSRGEARPGTPGNRWLAMLAIFFAGWVVLRAAPLLVALNLLASLGLLGLFVVGFRGDALPRLRAPALLGQLAQAFWIGVSAPLPLAAQSLGSLPLKRSQARRLLPIMTGLLLALPVLACFGGLLVAADSVFASYVGQLFSLELPFDPRLIISHTIFSLVVAYCCGGGLLAALLLPPPQPAPSVVDLPSEGETRRLTPPARGLRLLGNTEAITLMLAVDLLFGAFMLVQAAYFFGGSDTLQRSGMTYAEYARRGFFELLVVACLTLGLLGLLALLTQRTQARQRRIFNLAAGAMILLVNGLLASAFQRMLLYEEAYGFTQLRLYTQGFMVWLAVVLLLFLVGLLRAQARLFSWGSLGAALVFLATLNLLNPDALIVQQNMARYQASGKLDAAYLATLSADAAPALSAALPLLAGEQQELIRSSLAQQHADILASAAHDGWPAWSLAQQRASTAIAAAGIAPPSSAARRTVGR